MGLSINFYLGKTWKMGHHFVGVAIFEASQWWKGIPEPMDFIWLVSSWKNPSISPWYPHNIPIKYHAFRLDCSYLPIHWKPGKTWRVCGHQDVDWLGWTVRIYWGWFSFRKHTKSYGSSPCSMGNPAISTGPCSSSQTVSHYQRVNPV